MDHLSDELNNSLTSVAKGAGIVFAGMIAGNILGIANQIILGRFLGPEIYGIYNLSLSVVTIASTLAVFGFFGSLSRFIPFHLNKGEQAKVKSTIDFSIVFVFFSGLVLAVAIQFLARHIAVDVFKEESLTIPLRIFAAGLPAIGLQTVMQGITRGFKDVKYNAIIFNIGDRIIKILVFLASLAFIYRLYGAIVSHIAGAVATVIITMWFVSRRIFPAYRNLKRTPVAREVLSFSWPLALTGVSFLFVSKTDKIMLGYYLNVEDVGIYAPALVIAGMLIFVATAFKYIFLPTVSEYFARKDIGNLEMLFKSTSKWIFLIVLPIFLLILLFPKEIIRLLYGIKYTDGYLALIILSLGIALNDFAGTAGNVLVGGGHTKQNLFCEVIAAVTNIILNVVLIPRYGIEGAAAATGISYTTRNITELSFVYAAYRMHPYKANYLGILFSGAIAAGIVYALKMHSPFSWLVNMLALSVIFVCIFLALALVMKSFDANDRTVVEALERKTRLNLGFIKRFI